ncbi:MAG TPA: WecB/TagA/CpsF family glycosyltransferase [Terriglobales bacterium]|nr:WecB/TagA/CpsF family glycosyltransferase [Terriglobales bacterium]
MATFQQLADFSPNFRVLGVRVDAVQIPQVVSRMEDWIRRRDRTRYVAVTGMHGVSESIHDPGFRSVLQQADLVVPDGTPLVWLGRWHGHDLQRRVYGPELMETFCQLTGSRYRHFFYGGPPGVAEAIASTLQRKYQIQVAGTYTPPFRSLTADEERQLAQLIENSAPDVLWVALSTPKQEKWMYQHRDSFPVPVMLGVGAAFDLNLGRLRQAPRWMREHGLEWLFRLLMEPRRLWRRYLVNGPRFVFHVSLELLGMKKVS